MKETKCKYNGSYAELALRASETVSNMTRDTVEFAVRGVDSAAITAFEALGNSFEIFPPDEYYVGAIKDLTAEKNILRTTITGDIQLISGFFEQKYGINSGKYSSLRIKGLQKASEAKFLMVSRNVITLATANLSALTSIGLTQAMIDTLEDNAQLFEDKLIELNTAKQLRDAKALERIELANSLFDSLSMYCRIGKLIWENTNESKYNDYILYPSVQSGLSKPQNLDVEYIAGIPAVNHLTWDAVANATNYDIYVSLRDIGSPSGTFNLLDNVSDNYADLGPIIDKRNYYKIKAKNTDLTSIYSDEVFVDVPIS